MDGVAANYKGFGHDTSMVVPPKGELVICHFSYKDGTNDSCTVCKTVRERRDTIPAVCNSDFDYTINGLTVTVFVDTIHSSRRIWNFAHKAIVRDTLLANYTFNTPGVKRICQTTYTGSDSCACHHLIRQCFLVIPLRETNQIPMEDWMNNILSAKEIGM